jgi:glutamyl-Q tRNA(Asp) synthetase
LSENAVPLLITTRFAPSPTGLLHLGHAFSALRAWTRAREGGGRFLLRLEDIDAQRCRPEHADAILEDLSWLGLDWDGPVRVQSRHMAEYRAVLDRLAGQELLYPCFCSRAEILRELAQSATAPHGVPGSPEASPDVPRASPEGGLPYPGTCRRLDPSVRAERLAEGRPYALRLDMAAALRRVGAKPLLFEDADATGADRWQICHPEWFGDVVLARRDAPASYHLCVTHDDWRQGINLVTRGEDLHAATGLHRLLQTLLGWTPPAYSHHHLLRDAGGRRLAKRDQAQTLRALRERGMSPSEVRAMTCLG